ncbi:hypothetical protein EJ04DRAFT_553445 [Polyplosphaeria fusca]|uniref:Uncharacterized protein n=1 Tax=Polyplosphaeria fusca TaxID=682080 RepID=A0A9P4QVM4_9PLEO|nr:hypothetical protein EJ04DRAFT_553445 [Polyplosphaeria fusca]
MEERRRNVQGATFNKRMNTWTCKCRIDVSPSSENGKACLQCSSCDFFLWAEDKEVEEYMWLQVHGSSIGEDEDSLSQSRQQSQHEAETIFKDNRIEGDGEATIGQRFGKEDISGNSIKHVTNSSSTKISYTLNNFSRGYSDSSLFTNSIPHTGTPKPPPPPHSHTTIPPIPMGRPEFFQHHPYIHQPTTIPPPPSHESPQSPPHRPYPHPADTRSPNPNPDPDPTSPPPPPPSLPPNLERWEFLIAHSERVPRPHPYDIIYYHAEPVDLRKIWNDVTFEAILAKSIPRVAFNEPERPVSMTGSRVSIAGSRMSRSRSRDPLIRRPQRDEWYMRDEEDDERELLLLLILECPLRCLSACCCFGRRRGGRRVFV